MKVASPYKRYRVPLTPRARSLRRDPTPAERKLWYQFLRGLPDRFTRQKPLGRFIADFYCSARRLVIEVDGDSHYAPVAERYDAGRTAALEAMGLRVVRFTNIEVTQQFDGVCEQILRVLKT
jgi:very-short-patch-repair endonuclease